MQLRIKTIAYKACPRCGGDLALDSAEMREYSCLQCGRSQPAASVLWVARTGPTPPSLAA